MEMQYSYRPSNTYKVIVLSDDPLQTPLSRACTICQEKLSSKDYFDRGMRKLCGLCFGKVYGLKCFLCRGSITGLSKLKFIYFDGQAWHIQCFKCLRCNCPLLDCVQKDHCIHCRHCGCHVKFQEY